MKESVWFVVGALIGAGIVWMVLSAAPKGEGCDPNSNDVTLTLAGGSVPIVAKPDPACVEFPGRLHWTAYGKEGDVIRIDFKTKSPFPENTYQFTIAANGIGLQQSGQASVPPTGPGTGDCKSPTDLDCYKYDVTWQSGEKSVTVDPMVRIRNPP